jgi:hypothetical protein
MARVQNRYRGAKTPKRLTTKARLEKGRSTIPLWLAFFLTLKLKRMERQEILKMYNDNGIQPPLFGFDYWSYDDGVELWVYFFKGGELAAFLFEKPSASAIAEKMAEISGRDFLFFFERLVEEFWGKFETEFIGYINKRCGMPTPEEAENAVELGFIPGEEYWDEEAEGWRKKPGTMLFEGSPLFYYQPHPYAALAAKAINSKSIKFLPSRVNLPSLKLAKREGHFYFIGRE